MLNLLTVQRDFDLIKYRAKTVGISKKGNNLSNEIGIFTKYFSTKY